MSAMVHFLLVFDHSKGVLARSESFAKADRAAAAYAEAETEYQDSPDMEIVLVGADSIETIYKTHGHYFAESPLASKYLSLSY